MKRFGRVVVAWPICWLLFGVGDVAIILSNWRGDFWPEWIGRSLAWLYLRSLSASYRLQVWAEDDGPCHPAFPWGVPVA